MEPEKLIGSGSFIRLGSTEQHLAPLSNHGTGLQRTFLWSALKMLAETGRHQVGKKSVGAGTQKILLLEEPEAFLHPSAIRSAMESLYTIAEHSDWQIMITTHSPIFIDLTKDHTTIIRLEKRNQGHEIRNFSTDDAKFTDEDKDNLKMMGYCNPYFNEFFFSGYNLLVEGETEVTVVKTLMQMNKIQKDCVHVINCIGKANIVTVSKILNHFKVNYSIIHDADSPRVKRKENYIVNSMWTMNKKINDEILIGRQSGLVIKSFLSVPNFEGEYFGEYSGGSKPFGAWKIIQEETNGVADKFAEIIKSIMNMEHDCKVEYLNIVDLTKRVSKYIVDNRLDKEDIWTMKVEELNEKVL
ncbi:AAA family ATPase [Paenibacillus polymyxa]|uniref:ATP-dependent nuclease n=1 Tax=Paenibacillus polymyxa TaxID=1406 RepID=UPI001BEBF1F8|nr:AAA family ATPase [Paenibacillus polymyxa]MBT2285173.1 AAA family ATPase [Paenibacillus polymyxa]